MTYEPLPFHIYYMMLDFGWRVEMSNGLVYYVSKYRVSEITTFDLYEPHNKMLYRGVKKLNEEI